MKIEIWSDVACPWCYIGKHRFEHALQAFEHRSEVTVEWKSFELAPEMAAISPLNVAQHLTAAKGIAPAQVQQMLAQVTQAGASEGLQLKFDQARPFNTRNAHQLLHYAKTVGRQIELAERLFRASFTEGRQLGDTEVLIELATEAGLDPVAMRDVLENSRYRQAVIDDEATAQALGIRGVPFFVIDGKYGISGAQASATFAQALQTAWLEQRPLQAPGEPDAAGVCDSEGCAT